jgi:uncharacterized surface protein with fasciclin (FAS1) repeats
MAERAGERKDAMLSRPFNLLARAPKKDAMKRSARSLLGLSLALACAISACSSGGGSNTTGSRATTTTVQARSAREAIAYDPRLATFATALSASGVLGALPHGHRVTVFAPDDDAFARVPHAALLALLAQHTKGELAKLVRAHIVNGAIPQSALRDEKVKTLDGQTLTIKKAPQGITVTDGRGHTAKIDLPPIQATNAVIYPVNTVLWPVAARR